MTTHQFLTSAWEANPLVIALCVVVLVIYGWRIRFSARSGFLIAGLVLSALVLVSPVDALANGYLFSAHMLQHLVLLLVVPPLILLSLGGSSVVKRLAGRAISPMAILTCWLAGLGAMWIWHVPSLCSAATQSPAIHRVQYVSLLAMGTMFWWPILAPRREQRISPFAGIAYLFSACLGCTVLGIILTFAPLGACPAYLSPSDRLGILALIRDGWGFTPEKDQQLGGLLMWVPACMVYLAGIISQLVRWYGESAEEPGEVPIRVLLERMS